MRKVGFWTFLMCFTSLSLVESQENGDLRLSDGSNEGEVVSGRVEIYSNKVWGTLDAGTNERMMLAKIARTACRQLGYDSEASAGTVSTLNINPANDSVPMLLENIQCTDSTLHILRCSYYNISQPATPNHSKDFAVKCNMVDLSVHHYNTEVRLVQSETRYASSGYLEIYLDRSWGPVCNMFASDAYAACRQMGYTKAASLHTGLTYNGNGVDKADAFHCTVTDNYSCLKDCITTQPDAAICAFGHDILNCTFGISEAKEYGSGGESICSSSSVVAIAVGIVIAMLLLIIIIAVCAVVCCCCIPGCVLFNTRKRVVQYEKI